MCLLALILLTFITSKSIISLYNITGVNHQYHSFATVHLACLDRSGG